eukprot:6485775-Amphidinium_carterae.1
MAHVANEPKSVGHEPELHVGIRRSWITIAKNPGAAPGGHSIEKWHQNLRAAVTTATASHGAVASTAMDTPRTTAAGSSVGTSASSEASRPPGNWGRSTSGRR